MKLQMFNVATTDVDEIADMFGSLKVQVESYLGKEVSSFEVQNFALEDERTIVEEEADEESVVEVETEDVVVEDPLILMDMLKRVKTYFRNTACPSEVCYYFNLGRKHR